MIVNLHVPWLALAMAPRVAPRKSIPSCSLTDRHTVFTYHSMPPCQEPSCFLANTALPLRYCGVARILSARSARDGELPWCNCACPYVPPLCVACALSVRAPSRPLCWNARIASADDL